MDFSRYRARQTTPWWSHISSQKRWSWSNKKWDINSNMVFVYLAQQHRLIWIHMIFQRLPRFPTNYWKTMSSPISNMQVPAKMAPHAPRRYPLSRVQVWQVQFPRRPHHTRSSQAHANPSNCWLCRFWWGQTEAMGSKSQKTQDKDTPKTYGFIMAKFVSVLISQKGRQV